MSEYWKSTPKYWCKHCSTYVRDTKLERTNHEATGKHQGALKRFLRDLHRGHDQEQREKDRAKREIDRLNDVVGGASSAASSSAPTTASANKAATRPNIPPPSQGPATNAQRQKQWEQLAELGIDVPTELRGNMAMASEWTVTNTRVIDDRPKAENAGGKVGGIATGVRKRNRPEGGGDDDDDDEGADKEAEVIRGLFKKPKKWGRDSKQAPEDDADLDALLNTNLARQPKKEEQGLEAVKKEEQKEEEPAPGIKQEEDGQSLLDATKPISTVEGNSPDEAPVKTEEPDAAEAGAPAVVFKKRKPKNIRQK